MKFAGALAFALGWPANAPLCGAAPEPAAPPATLLRLGTNNVPRGGVVEFRAPLSAAGQSEAARAHKRMDFVRVGLAVPPEFDLRRGAPLLIISAPSGGESVPSLRAYTNAAFAEGWAVLAADAPMPLDWQEDGVTLRWGLVSSALEHVARQWPASRAWPTACGGFSGGAKVSGCVAAALIRDGRRVLGIFMGGCNEDLASTGQLLFAPGAAFYAAPVFLSNGTEDRIANAGHGAQVMAALQRNGFKRVRLETYPGGHRLHEPHVREALLWFRPPPATRPPTPAPGPAPTIAP